MTLKSNVCSVIGLWDRWRMKKRNKKYAIPLNNPMFHLPLGLLYVVKHQHLYRQSFFSWQVSPDRESLVLSACTNDCPICTGRGFFLVILLELSHITLISKFSHLSLMAFLKVHLSAIESRFKASCVPSKTFIRTAQNIRVLLLLFEHYS